jgi:tetratricopeptide (TPR) repeat protein
MTALHVTQSSESSFGNDSMEVAACFNCIGVLHYAMPSGQQENALKAFKTSLNIRRKLLGDNHVVATSWNNIGRLYYLQGKFKEALQAYYQALRIRRLLSQDGQDCVDR